MSAPGWTALQTSYNARIPIPQLGPLTQPSTDPLTPGPVSGYANGYWMSQVQGVATFIGLTSYSPNDIDASKPDYNGFSVSSAQYIWLERTLKVSHALVG